MPVFKIVVVTLLVWSGLIGVSASANDVRADSQSVETDKELRLLLVEAGGSSPTGAKQPEVPDLQVEELKSDKYHTLSPAMAMKMRNPASLSYPDGITGPHSDLFRKIRSRYASENLTSPPKRVAPDSSH